MRILIATFIASALLAAGLVSPVVSFADHSGKDGRGERVKAEAVNIEQQLADDINRSVAVTPPRVSVRPSPAVVMPDAGLGNAGTTEIEDLKDMLDLL